MGPDDALLYGPESYDAVILSALAAIAAGDDSGEAIGANIVDVAREGTKCTTFEECADLLDDGEDIDYDGKSGAADMTDTGSLGKPAPTASTSTATATPTSRSTRSPASCRRANDLT